MAKNYHSVISCKSVGEATWGRCCISLYRGTLVNPEQFHHDQNSGSLNQSLKASQPKVSITNFLCLKSLVWWTQGKCPGKVQMLQKTSCSLTQQLSSQWEVSRHRGHQFAGWSSAVQSNDSCPVWWHRQQKRILAKFRSRDALRVRLLRKLPFSGGCCCKWSALRRPDFGSSKTRNCCSLVYASDKKLFKKIKPSRCWLISKAV